MAKSQLQHYECTIQGNRIKPVSLDGTPVTTFCAPATSPGVQKLYVVKHNGDFCYVGIAEQSITSRLRYGFNPNVKTGYHGYPWRHLPNVDLYVWTTKRFGRKAMEAIEAELVFATRLNTGKWPTHQMEIHFHNPFPAAARCQRRIAQALFQILK
jgi:hypothetical protein